MQFDSTSCPLTGQWTWTITANGLQAQSKPMQAILRRMNLIDEFEIVMFGDEVRLDLCPCAHLGTATARTAAWFIIHKRKSATVHIFWLSSITRHTGTPACR